MGEGGRDQLKDHLISLGKLLDFEVVVIDHKPVLSSQPDVLIDELDFDLGQFPFSVNDAVVLLTKGAHDVEFLKCLAQVKLRYVGLLASRRRLTHSLKELRSGGVDEAFLESLRAPIGVDIGATTPGELAVSIMAEVVANKYGRELPRKGEAAKAKGTDK